MVTVSGVRGAYIDKGGGLGWENPPSHFGKSPLGVRGGKRKRGEEREKEKERKRKKGKGRKKKRKERGKEKKRKRK